MAVVAKKKSRPAFKKMSETKLRELADQSLAAFQADSELRYQGAKAVYDEQDNQTKDALDRMIDLLSGIARRRMWVSAGGENRMVVTLPDQVIRHNMTYMAVEILKDLAIFDVKVDNFTFPDHLCGVCNRPRKKVKKK